MGSEMCIRDRRLGDDAREPSCIKTVRSEGYVFSLPVQLLESPS